MNDNYWSWLQEQTQRNEAERAAFSEHSSVLLLDEPEIELEPPVPTGFESFWK